MPGEEASADVVTRRVRNRIIEYLELASSFVDQREYQANVPYVSVPSEVINQWQDWVRENKIDEWYGPPVYTREEHEAIVEFHSTWDDVAAKTPDPFPPLEETLRLEQWQRLREAAKRALSVFQRRGKLRED